MARVLVTTQVPPGGLDPLIESGHEIVHHDSPRQLSPAELVNLASQVDAIVCVLSNRINDDVLGAGDRLRVVANIAVGFDNIDVAAAARRRIAVCNTPGALDAATADLAMLLILAATRLTTDAEASLRRGDWGGWRLTEFLGEDLEGRTLGIVGFGRIGQALARRATAFGMVVTHHSRRPSGQPGYVGDLDELFRTSDVISLHVPFTSSTHHLVDERRLGLMKPSAVLVNTARGQIVDEAALARALVDGRIFAAGLDVFEQEPKVHADLLEAPHAVLLPHIGSATLGTRRRMTQLACKGAVAVLAGEQPSNLVSVTT